MDLDSIIRHAVGASEPTATVTMIDVRPDKGIRLELPGAPVEFDMLQFLQGFATRIGGVGGRLAQADLAKRPTFHAAGIPGFTERQALAAYSAPMEHPPAIALPDTCCGGTALRAECPYHKPGA